MNDRITALERAFQLAKSGSCESIEAIRRQLRREHFSTEQIMGPSLATQLRELMRKAEKTGNPGEPTIPERGR